METSEAFASATTTAMLPPAPRSTSAVNGVSIPPSPTAIHRDHPATEDCGLVSNDSLLEGELDAFAAPEAALQEEERLRQEREAADAANDPPPDPAQAVLDSKKFEQLERLLNQSEMFTQFLAEQMTAAEETASQQAEEAAAAGARGGKRKAAAAAAPKLKKHRGDAPPEVTKELCPGFVGSLRDYQLKGVKWLISLYQNGLSGILADQMGLGKTVQTIAFLCHMRGKGIQGPFLVLGPLSTLSNWVDEFKRWAPEFPVVLYHGSKDERHALRSTHSLMNTKIDGAFPVVVTSYEIAIADIKFLQKQTWKYVVVDEGHRLKNMNCKLIRELKTLRMDNKLLLTGTPLQNNLTELWSLLNFLLPDVFSSLENFESWFDFAASVGQEGGDREIIAQEQRSKVISKLHAILKPFLLRRIKSDVETSLPGKMEIILYANMSEKQREINQQLRDKTLGAEMAKSKARGGGGGASMTSLNNMLMQMRKNCNHPDLITAPFEGSVFFPSADQLVADCGKMKLLDNLLTRLFKGGHKVLIFSQMTAMLDVIDAYLEEKGVVAVRIDGSVSWQERQARMKQFNDDPEAKVFLLSTRAGGLGINLTAADTCIIYDSDWNPHQDLQAMDRCHRIGQTRPVLVLRLATAHSVEGKMLRRANSKLMLERLVIKKGAFLDVDTNKSSMSSEELLEMLKADVTLDDVPQSAEVSDAMMEKILDRTHLSKGARLPYPESGPGYEVVQQLEGSGLLTGIE